MEKLMNGVKQFIADEEGVTMVEYGMIAALIAIVSLIVITGVGTNLRAVFRTVCNALNIPTVVGAAACA